ncbi:MFS transporter [Pseudonocardia alaniniphila]|uniref:MFS transporter n=1 Tax=Pseudonocardia alaniniphila TaxID=75291 RepID=A0ABS9T9J0_9PSEU|nr:MFS transporter [Pseudonocardia alaniniphila]MCH6165088.1 MFS transporter [Pseudonocardia alaniniphila]
MALDEFAPPRRRRGRIGFKYSWLALVALWLVYAMNGNMRQLVFAVQPSIVQEFRITPGELGLFTGFLTLAQAVLVLPLSIWSDRGGHGWARKFRELPVALGYLVFSLLTGIGGLTHSFVSLFTLQAVKNAFSGAGESLEVTAVAEWWPVERRGFAQGLHHTAFPWGSLIGGWAVAAILASFGSSNWRLVFLLLPLATIPILIFYWVVSSKGRFDAFVADTRGRGLTVPVAGDTADRDAAGSAPGAVGRALRNPNVLVSAIASGLGLAIYTGINFWIPLYLAFVAHYDFAQVAAYSVMFTITGGIGQILWGTVSDRIGRKYTLIICFLWLTVALILLQQIGISLGWLIGVQLFLGMATNGIYPVLYALSSDSSEKGAVAIGNGLQMVGQGIGGLSPILLGWLIGVGGGFASARGFDYGLYFLAALQLLAAILMALFTRETIGIFKHRDRALVSREACNIDAATAGR